MQGTNLLTGSNVGFRVLPKDPSTLTQGEPGFELGTLRALITVSLPLSYAAPHITLILVLR